MTAYCRDDARRPQVRARPELNGLDYVEVGDDPTTLTVYFLGKAPLSIKDGGIHYFQIEGGRRIRDIHVMDVKVERERDPELDDRARVRVNQPGDFSTYTLWLLGVENIDPRYDHIQFTFKANCPSDLDCVPAACPPAPLVEPDINYLAKDYASFRQLILDRLALLLPHWKERHVPDMGLTLIEILAYVGDHLSYYQDAVGTEAYLDTARQRISVRRHARLVDYRLHEGNNARAWVCVEVDTDLALDPADAQFVTGLKDAPVVVTREVLEVFPVHTYQIFEAVSRQTIPLRVAHNTLYFYTWGERECCLPRGTTSATLRDAYMRQPAPPDNAKALQSQPESLQDHPRTLRLQAGDVLILEEVIGPKTGHPADADPAHRHAVRLTRVTSNTDPLTGQPLLEVEWAIEDALPFALCLSATTTDCKYVENISVARGNVILVDHGQTVEPEELSVVPTATLTAGCECEGQPGDARYTPGPYSPTLEKTPVTFREPAALDAPAAKQLRQNPRQALPQVRLTGAHHQRESNWEPRLDLLESGPDDQHFVVELDNAGHAHLRFGNGELGRAPDAGMTFTAHYRVGHGVAGHVGAEAIQHIVFRKSRISGGLRRARNPFPAQGGLDSEPLAEAKLLAPNAFRQQLERAITAADYAHIVQRDFAPRVERAAAGLRWNGSWNEALVAMDAAGMDTASPTLLQTAFDHLRRYRRMGHDVRVTPARYVSVDIALTICVRPNYLRGHVKAALLDVFSPRRRADGRAGFFHPDRLTFGEGVYVSQLVAAAQAVPGVESVRVMRLQRQFEAPNRELENGVLPLGPLDVARLDNDPNFPEHGQLELDVRGGR